MNLRQEIQNGWSCTGNGNFRKIEFLEQQGFQTWTSVRTNGEPGVAIPYNGEPINERFAGFSLRSNCKTDDGIKVLCLEADSSIHSDAFSLICQDFVDPGVNGAHRESITRKPQEFWKTWKDLVGNRDADDGTCPVVAELYVLKLLAEAGLFPEWHGPESKVYDIELEQAFFEVKSSTVLKSKTIHVQSGHQLKSLDERPLYLVFTQWERMSTGISINTLVDELVALSFDKDAINKMLAKDGLPEGKIARNYMYVLHELNLYSVDEHFPRITDECFIGGKMPRGIQSYEYEASLDGVKALNWDETINRLLK